MLKQNIISGHDLRLTKTLPLWESNFAGKWQAVFFCQGIYILIRLQYITSIVARVMKRRISSVKHMNFGRVFVCVGAGGFHGRHHVSPIASVCVEPRNWWKWKMEPQIRCTSSEPAAAAQEVRDCRHAGAGGRWRGRKGR